MWRHVNRCQEMRMRTTILFRLPGVEYTIGIMPFDLTRRALLATVPALAAAPRQSIVSVKAAPMPLIPTSRFGTRKFHTR